MNPREGMIQEIKDKYKLRNKRVFEAMLSIPREKFVSKRYEKLAYEDRPIPIDHGQTLSQPYTVAFMTHLLNPDRSDRILEIGTGSGYQAAVLSFLVDRVFTIERIGKLAKRAKKRMKKLDIKNVHIKSGQGELGWSKAAPFSGAIITAGIEGKVPDMIFDQLIPGGVLIAPIVHRNESVMTKFTKKNNRVTMRKYGKFQFVPFVRQGLS